MPYPVFSLGTPKKQPQILPRPMMSGARRKTGLSGSFDINELPFSTVLAAAGIGGFFLASGLSSPIREIVTAAGVGFIGYGVYNLFSAPVEAAPEVDTDIEPGTESGPGGLLLGYIVNPPNEGSVEEVGEKYYIEFKVTNHGTTPQAAKAIFIVKEYTWGAGGDPVVKSREYNLEIPPGETATVKDGTFPAVSQILDHAAFAELRIQYYDAYRKMQIDRGLDAVTYEVQ